MEPAEIVKSTNRTDTTTVRDSVPEVAVTVTVYVEAISEETVRVDKPGPEAEITTLTGFRVAVNPGADTMVAKIMVPEKPLTPVTAIVEFARDPTSATMKS